MDEIIEKEATFIDNLGYLHTVEIEYSPNDYINITSYLENRPSGYMHISINSNNRLFLNTIYCYDEFRGRGIATKINDLAMFLLKDFDGYILRGIYNPTQLSTDRNNQEDNFEELDKRAKAFYKSCGYDIITLEEYYQNPEIYPELNIEQDFKYDEKVADCIVLKRITKLNSYNFMEIEGDYVDIKKSKRTR